MKKYILLLSGLFFGLFIGEWLMRQVGYKPGVFLSNQEIKAYWYEYDGGKMQQYEFFKPDSFGLFKVNQNLVKIEKNPPVNYAQIINGLKHTSFNSDGFRGREFGNTEDERKKIFFLGDSYTFGFDAEPFDSSYVNVLEDINKKYMTFNGGVPGSNLASYAVVAEKYIPKVKPDLVVVCITKDDNVPYNQVLKPYTNSDLFLTSKGILFTVNPTYSDDSVQVFEEAEDAYQNLMVCFTSKYLEPSWLKWIVDQSTLVTLITGKLFYKPNLSLLKHNLILPKQDISRQCVNRILRVAEAYNAKVIFTIIPKTFDKSTEMRDVRKVIGDSVSLFFPSGISKEDFGPYHKAHFNNNGHRFYANFLNQTISDLYK